MIVSPPTTSGCNKRCRILFAGHSLLLHNTFPVDGSVRFHGESSWFAITTHESFNGHRLEPSFSTYIRWYAANAFGGTNYQNTPAAAVANSDECGCNPNHAIFLSLWQSRKNAAI